MRLPRPSIWVVGLILLAAPPASATSPVRIVIGPIRDGASHDLQRKVDAVIGAGRLDVRADYVGARPGDPDPWMWANPGQALTIQLIDRKSSDYVIGWYDEASAPDAGGDDDDDDGDDDDGMEDVLGGVVLDGGRKRGARVTFRMPASVEHFGLFVADLDDDHERAWFRHRTNRTLNSPGVQGKGAQHEPYDGDVQLLVYDVSRWLGTGTWLVAGEISDSGGRVGADDDCGTDNDYADVLFTVSGAGVTPITRTSFGRLKSMFR